MALTALAGGDPDLREAMSDGGVASTLTRQDGVDVYCYDIAGGGVGWGLGGGGG
jgi:hypothetical protein